MNWIFLGNQKHSVTSVSYFLKTKSDQIKSKSKSKTESNRITLDQTKAKINLIKSKLNLQNYIILSQIQIALNWIESN